METFETEYGKITLYSNETYITKSFRKKNGYWDLTNLLNLKEYIDPKKNIRVRRIITPNWCVWQIQDQGNGLEIKKRDYKLPKKISSVSGRGLYIINECFDDIRWSSKGNRLQLALKR